MKNRLLIVFCVATVALSLSTSVFAHKWWNSCAKIKDGTIYDPLGNVIEYGYDQWGYNYQARKFKGTFCDAFYGPEWCQSDNSKLVMKWNRAWLDTRDCDGDGALDSHAGHETYRGSGAWLINHHSGSYVDEETGEECSWFNLTKTLAVPEDAEEIDGIWYNAEGEEIGERAWGDFAYAREISHDTCEDEHGFGRFFKRSESNLSGQGKFKRPELGKLRFPGFGDSQ